MALDFLTKKRNKKIKEFESHIRSEFLEKIKEHKYLCTEIKELPERMNSYEQNLFMPFWSDELLISQTKKYLSEAHGEFYETDEYTIDDSYNEVLKHKIIWMLLKKLEEKKLI